MERRNIFWRVTLKIRIRSGEDRRRILSADGWTRGAGPPLEFQTTLEAVFYAIRNQIPNAELVVEFEKSGNQVIVPIT